MMPRKRGDDERPPRKLHRADTRAIRRPSTRAPRIFEDPDFAVRLGEVFRDPDAYMAPEEYIAETVDAEPLFPAGGVLAAQADPAS